MAVPTSYTDDELAGYMHAALGATAVTLGWSVVESVYAEPVNDALILYGVSDISDATDIDKLRAAARLAAWRAVAAETATNFRFRAGQQSFDRQQVHEHALAMITASRTEAMRHGIEHTLGHVPVFHRHDPYAYRTDAERSIP